MVTTVYAVPANAVGDVGVPRPGLGHWGFLQFEGCRNGSEKVDCRGMMLASENEATNLES
jgi:hypothetical protein